MACNGDLLIAALAGCAGLIIRQKKSRHGGRNTCCIGGGPIGSFEWVKCDGRARAASSRQREATRCTGREEGASTREMGPLSLATGYFAVCLLGDNSVPGGKRKLECGHFSQSKCISPARPGRRLIEEMERLPFFASEMLCCSSLLLSPRPKPKGACWDESLSWAPGPHGIVSPAASARRLRATCNLQLLSLSCTLHPALTLTLTLLSHFSHVSSHAAHASLQWYCGELSLFARSRLCVHHNGGSGPGPGCHGHCGSHPVQRLL
jgi:hypothetical protein